MEVLVWGAGAIGGTAGAYLARAGHMVTFVDRDRAHVEAINQRGLTITGPIDQFTVRATAFTPDTLNDKHRAVLLCVKAQDTQTAAQALQPHLPEDGFVVSLQNGLNELMIANVLGRERTVGAFVNYGADYEEPGVIMFGGAVPSSLGNLMVRVRHGLLRSIRHCSTLIAMPSPPKTSGAISGENSPMAPSSSLRP